MIGTLLDTRRSLPSRRCRVRDVVQTRAPTLSLWFPSYQKLSPSSEPGFSLQTPWCRTKSQPEQLTHELVRRQELEQRITRLRRILSARVSGSVLVSTSHTSVNSGLVLLHKLADGQRTRTTFHNSLDLCTTIVILTPTATFAPQTLLFTSGIAILSAAHAPRPRPRLASHHMYVHLCPIITVIPIPTEHINHVGHFLALGT